MTVDVGSFPQRGNFQYCSQHLWVSIEEGIATIGLTDFAQKSVGPIDSFELPDIHQFLQINASFGAVDGEKAVIKLRSPISGIVAEVHESLRRGGASANARPYGFGSTGGWLIKVRIIGDLPPLMSTPEYVEYVQRTARTWI